MVLKAILAVLIISGIFAFSYNFLYKKNNEYKKKQTDLAEKKQELLERDSDNDGLKDWEEVLWKTDPNNPDTDRDGTRDGEEIKLNRDPTKPGPNDSFSNAGDTGDATEEKTLTEKIGKEFLLKYLSSKGTENLTNKDKENMANELISNLSEKPQIKYTISDIKISSDNSEKNIKNYINSLASAFETLNLMQIGDLEILNRILADENGEHKDLIKEFEKNKSLYDKTTRDTLALNVPSNYKTVHLGFLNSFNNAGAAVLKMSLIYDDPAKTILGVKEYKQESANLLQIFKIFKAQTARDKIKFTPSEKAYIFEKIYFKNI